MEEMTQNEMLCKLALENSEQKFRSLFEDAIDMIHVVNSEGILTDVNKTELATLEYSREELIGKKFTDLVTPDYIDASNKAFQKLKSGKKIEKYDTCLLTKSGEKIHVSISAYPELEDGEFISVRSISRNVTDIYLARKEIENTNRLLVEKNRELEQIVYVTSHDLRSPLVNIQGFKNELEFSIIELKKILKELSIPDEMEQEILLIVDQEIPESMDFISTGISKMDSLLNGLLSISRLGRIPLEIRRLNMGSLINDVVKNFEYKVKENFIDIRIDKLPDCRGDMTQLNQVFSNLIENAIKYRNKDNDCVIQISGKKKKGNIIYEVSDNGIGIHKEKHKRIFEIFYQDQPGMKGEGLGLTLVRKIIERHLGDISIKSEPGKGTTFVITLPEKS